MEIILKIVLFVFFLGLAFSLKYFYDEFKKSKSTDAYDNTTLLGKFIANTMFIIISGAIISLAVFITFIIVSKITISWAF